MSSMLDETPAEMALRLDPGSPLTDAIRAAEEEHVNRMTQAAGAYIFGMHLALKDGVLGAAEAAGFEARIRDVVRLARHSSAQKLYDIRDEMQETVERNAAFKQQDDAEQSQAGNGPTLN